MLVQHHVKYEEIHGKDEIVMMERGEHISLHDRLREEGKCNIPAAELHKISHAAHRRTEAGRQAHNKRCAKYAKENVEIIDFSHTVDAGISIRHRVRVNSKTGTVCVIQWFTHPRRKIVFIDIP